MRSFEELSVTAFMESRPKIKIGHTTTDRFVEIAGWAALAFIWIITFYYFRKLPETIPTHFNVKGTADGFGQKSTIFLLPAIGTVLFIGMTILNRFPHIFNYPVRINSDNAIRQYTLATRLLRILKVSIVLIFLMITWMTSAAANNQGKNSFAWFLPVMLAITFVPLGIYIFKSFRAK